MKIFEIIILIQWKAGLVMGHFYTVLMILFILNKGSEYFSPHCLAQWFGLMLKPLMSILNGNCPTDQPIVFFSKEQSFYYFYLFYYLISGRDWQFARSGLLYPDRHPLHHPGLLYSAYYQPAQEEDSWRQNQAEESCLFGDLCHGGLLFLLPALRYRQDGSADRPGPSRKWIHPG